MGLRNPTIWIVLILLVIVLFGASKLPDITRNVGKSLKIFKEEVRDLRDDKDADSTTATPPVVEGTSSAPNPQPGPAPTQPEQPPAAPHPSTPPADTTR